MAGSRVLAVSVGAAVAGATGAATASSLVEATGFLTALVLLTVVLTAPSRTRRPAPSQPREHL